MEVKDEMRPIGNEESAGAIQSCDTKQKVSKVRFWREREGGGELECVQHTGAELTFFQQRVKLVEERREMDDDARTDDARDGRVDQSYTKKQRAIRQFSFCWGGGGGRGQKKE